MATWKDAENSVRQRNEYAKDLRRAVPELQRRAETLAREIHPLIDKINGRLRKARADALGAFPKVVIRHLADDRLPAVKQGVEQRLRAMPCSPVPLPAVNELILFYQTMMRVSAETGTDEDIAETIRVGRRVELMRRRALALRYGCCAAMERLFRPKKAEERERNLHRSYERAIGHMQVAAEKLPTNVPGIDDARATLDQWQGILAMLKTVQAAATEYVRILESGSLQDAAQPPGRWTLKMLRFFLGKDSDQAMSLMQFPMTEKP